MEFTVTGHLPDPSLVDFDFDAEVDENGEDEDSPLEVWVEVMVSQSDLDIPIAKCPTEEDVKLALVMPDGTTAEAALEQLQRTAEQLGQPRLHGAECHESR